MTMRFTRRAVAALTLAALAAPSFAQDKVTLRMSTPASETDQRSVALAEVFAPAVAEFADYQPHYNGSLIAQGSELEAIASGDLEMSITSAQELAQFFPEFSIFATGYVHQDAAHQVRVFNDPLMDPFKQKVEDELGRQASGGHVSRPPPREPAPDQGRADRDDPGRSRGRQPADAGHGRVAVPRQGAGRQSDADGLHRGLYRACRPDRSTGRTTRCPRWSTRSSTRSPTRSR